MANKDDLLMKSMITTSLFIFLFFSSISAQEFAPIGAKWTVELREPFEPNWRSTLTNESLRDTILEGRSCKVIYKSQATIFNEISGEYIICQTGDSIYHYIPELDTFNLVMNFAAEVGEYWESFDQANNYVSFGFEMNYKYMVDSISYLPIENGDSLRVQHLKEYTKFWTEPESEYRNSGTRKLIQYLGFEKALLPTNGGDGFSDDIFEWNIRCYEDNNIGLIKLTEDFGCLPSSVYNLHGANIQISPNPTGDQINIDNQSEYSFDQLVILNHLGIEVLKTQYHNNIDLVNLESGFYVLQLKSKETVWSEQMMVIR